MIFTFGRASCNISCVDSTIGISFVLDQIVPLVFFPTMLAIKLSDPGPIFYFQERIGYRRRKFRFWKFRSMRVGADAELVKLAHLNQYADPARVGTSVFFKIQDDPRITAPGHWLRRFSVDETPPMRWPSSPTPDITANRSPLATPTSSGTSRDPTVA